MSKKSRKRNKKILAAIGIGLGAAALASRKNKSSGVSDKAKKELGDTETTSRMGSEFTKSTTPTIADVSNKTKFITKKKATPKVYQDDIMKGGSGTKYVDKYAGTPLRRLQNSPLRTDGLGDMDMKDGGRARHKSGGSVKKSMGKALRGGGKVMR
jgi:hypothetical protein